MRSHVPTVLGSIALISLMVVLPSVSAVTWPSGSDLSGTDTSGSLSGVRYDLDTTGSGRSVWVDTSTNQALMAGDDTTIFALGAKLRKKIPEDFSVSGMAAGDKYEIRFTSGTRNFAVFFRASGASAGSMKLFHKLDTESTWTDAETFTVASISSGTTYDAGTGNMGFMLADPSGPNQGEVRFWLDKNNLINLGGDGGNAVTGIYAESFSGAGGSNPGADGGTSEDRAPSTGGVSYTLVSSPIPFLPFGALPLAAATVLVYYLYRRIWSRRGLNGG